MILHGDCLEKLRELKDNSVDSIVTDPPYGLSFMGKKWDYDVPSVEIWKECLRVLKPGGHALIACGTRTQHRMALNIEDAGFEIRDVITWLYGSGFPKSLDVSKAIDKAAGAERENDFKSTTIRKTANSNSHKGTHTCNNCGKYYGSAAANCHCPKSLPSTDLAKQWSGYGTALKPACEFWTLARKPLSESTVAKNVERWGTGGINIDGCRVNFENGDTTTSAKSSGLGAGRETANANAPAFGAKLGGIIAEPHPQGRFPANLILDEVAGQMLDEQSWPCKTGDLNGQPRVENKTSRSAANTLGTPRFYKSDAATGASRFFYCAKASKSERNKGLEGMRTDAHSIKNEMNTKPSANHHPTVKPVRLMEYLIKLVTPPGGTVLDCFAGSGSTLVAAKKLGFKFIGIEREKEYVEIIERRVEAA